MSEKSRFRGPFHKQHGKTGPNTVANWTTTPLPYLLITVKIIQLEKRYFSAMQKS